MWDEGQQLVNTVDINKEILSLPEEIDEETAQISFAKFLRYNLGISTQLLTGFKLLPIQEVMLNIMFSKDFSLFVVGRGGSKSTTAAIFAGLYALFNPGSRILILAPVYRQSMLLFQSIEKIFYTNPNATNFRSCLGSKNCMTKGTIECKFTIGRSEIRAVPLSGDKIRGFRANVIICDETLLIPEKVLNEVVSPIISVSGDVEQKVTMYEQESQLIAKGLMKESERTRFENPKLVYLSSASYKFEHLYKIYENYINIINAGKNKNASYAVVQVGYKAMPPIFYGESSIEQAQATMSDAQFRREFGAEFLDDSGGYFRMSKMMECTVPFGQTPSVEIKGDPKSKYILAIDPNFRDQLNSDHFSMCLLKLDEENKTAYLVHNYAIAGVSQRHHIQYLAYIMKNFNVVYIIGDDAGSGQFINNANDSEIFREMGLKISTFNADFLNADYSLGVRNSRASYCFDTQNIFHEQYFTPGWIRAANELLQTNFDRKRIWFASEPNEDNFSILINMNLDVSKLKFDHNEHEEEGKILDFITHQGELIKLTQKECALIEVTSTSTGHQAFDLPANLRKQKTENKARKDSYTTLLMANYAARCYFDMKNTIEEEESNTFEPQLY